MTRLARPRINFAVNMLVRYSFRRSGPSLSAFYLAMAVACATTTFSGCRNAGALGTISNPPDLEPYTESLSGTTVSFEMVPVPAGMLRDSTGDVSIATPGFWISSTEITWDVYDVFVFGLDGTAGPKAADAIAKPSKPYVLPGDDFGHAGMPALGMTSHAADRFAEWLSAKTGKTYRILTEAEWEYACDLNTAPANHPDPNENGRSDTNDQNQVNDQNDQNAVNDANESVLDQIAWHRGNGGDGTHPVGSKSGGPLGVFDILGNAAEWVHGRDGQPVVKGGSYLDRPANVSCAARRAYSKSWQMTDPQIPKSPWWLSDGPFVALRIMAPADQN